MDSTVPDLKTTRQRLGWSQQRMADYLGLDQSNVSRIERGKHALSGPARRLLGQLDESRPEAVEFDDEDRRKRNGADHTAETVPAAAESRPVVNAASR